MIGVLSTVIDDPDVEIRLRRQPGHRLPDVPGSDDHQSDPRHRGHPRHAASNLGPGAVVERNNSRGDARRYGAVRPARLADPIGTEQEPAASLDLLVLNLTIGGNSLGIDDHGFREALTDLDQMVQGAEIGQRTTAAQGLDGDHHLAPADQAVCPGVIMVEDEGPQRCPRVTELADGKLLDLVLDAPAAQCSGLSAGGIDDHDHPGLLGRRTFRLHDLAIDLLTSRFQGFDECSEKVTHGVFIGRHNKGRTLGSG